MTLVRALVLLLLLAAIVLFGLHALTGRPHFKRWGLAIMRWTIGALLVFFAVMFADRLR